MKKLLNILFVLLLVLPLYGQSSLDNPIVFTPYLYVPGWISTDSLYARVVVISSTLDLSGTISGDLDVTGKAVVEESLRVEKTALVKGKGTFNDSLVVIKGLRNESISTLKGDVDARTKVVIGDSIRVEETARIKGTSTFGATATPTVLSTDGSVSQTVNSANAAKTDQTVTDSYNPTTGQTGSTLVNEFKFSGTRDGGSTYANRSGVKFESYKLSDYFHASDGTDEDAGFKIYNSVNGTPTEMFNLGANDLTLFAGSTPTVSFTRYQMTSASLGGYVFAHSVDLPNAGNIFNFTQGTVFAELTGAAGVQTFLAVTPEIAQTVTAGYTGIGLNVTETTTGSGNKYLMDLQVGSATKFNVSNAGTGYFAGNLGIGTTAPGSKLDVKGAASGSVSSDTLFSVFNDRYRTAATRDTTFDIMSDGNVHINNAVRYVRVVSLADGAQHLLPTGKAGFGKVSCNGEFATFYFTTAGTVSLVTAATPGLTSANVTTTEDNDATLNIFDDGSGIGIENELGNTYNVLIDITYF